ncbi:DNA polymerase [Angustibacter luteus]|uniref:DNA-directed DNA polymerase n=1 Tax=Angustibacter luteus TaxID=658456 RepID=A0ABW1JBQ4_9ACTN
MPADDAVTCLRQAGAQRGALVALVVHPDVGAALAFGDRSWSWPREDTAPQALAQRVEDELRPRWVWWSAAASLGRLRTSGLHLATCWDLAVAHRMLAGGQRDGPPDIWSLVHDLDPDSAPRTGQLDLLGTAAEPSPAGRAGPESSAGPESPVDSSGHLRAEWVDGGWGRTEARLRAWALLVLRVQTLQAGRLAERGRHPTVSGEPERAVHAESAAAMLCVELERDGLPIDVPQAEQLIDEAVGPRPADAHQAAALRRARDLEVMRHAPQSDGVSVDLRNPAQVRGLLAGIGIDVPDTRSWRLEPWREQHPLVEALLAWRKADRIGTTYGYTWLDRFVGPDARLRGPWQASDGAAGRMTAGAGLHNLPAELRPAVAAPAGHVLVRADLGQIEPRVLAAISGDPALTSATLEDDLYLPVAQRLRVERPIAKVAVLAAMYGQTSGTAGEALKGLDRAYPVAMQYLRRASDEGRAGRPVFTHGGRRVPMWGQLEGLAPDAQSSLAAARGRFARNAVVQGSAAELFKAWAVTVRAQARALNARVVLCLHDELLVECPTERADEAVALLHRTLDVVGAAWAPRSAVRFVADVRVVHRWSEAKE